MVWNNCSRPRRKVNKEIESNEVLVAEGLAIMEAIELARTYRRWRIVL